jgi:secreted PhoX family phosphatase
MSSLPTIEQDNYTTERSVNDNKIIEIFSQLFPDTPVPYEYIFDLVRLLEQTRVNAAILPQIIDGISSLYVSGQAGQVIVHVNKELTNVQVRKNAGTIKTMFDDIEK